MDSEGIRHSCDVWFHCMMCCLILPTDGNLVLASVKYPGFHVGVLGNGEVKKPNLTGDGKHGQFKVKVIKEQSEYYRAGTNLIEVWIILLIHHCM